MHPKRSEDPESRFELIRNGLEFECRFNYESELDKYEHGYNKEYSDFCTMLSGNRFEKQPYTLISLLIEDDKDYYVRKLNPATLSPELQEALYDIQNSSQYKYLAHSAERLALWMTVRDMVFDSAFKQSSTGRPLDKDAISLDKARIKAFAQSHKLLMHGVRVKDLSESYHVDYSAITNMVDDIYGIALDASKDIDRRASREFDAELLKEADSTQLALIRKQTSSTRNQLYDRLFHGDLNLFNDAYTELLQAMKRNTVDHASPVECNIEPEEILGVVNRNMRLEQLRKGEQTTYAQYWASPTGTRKNDVQAKCWLGEGSHYGSIGEKAGHIVVLRSVMEHIFDAVAKDKHGVLDVETLINDQAYALTHITGLHLSEEQARAGVKVVIDEVERMQTEKRSVREL